MAHNRPEIKSLQMDATRCNWCNAHSRAPCQSRLRRGRGRWWLPLHLDVQVTQLLRLDGAGQVGHQACALRGIQGRDDVS